MEWERELLFQESVMFTVSLKSCRWLQPASQLKGGRRLSHVDQVSDLTDLKFEPR